MNKIVLLLMLAMAAPASAQATAMDETLPDCSDETIGFECVERRESIGPWEIVEVVPPVGSQNALLMTTSSFQELPGIFGRTSPAELVLSCIENTTRFEVRFGENFMSDIGEYGTLIYKVDDGAPVALDVTASPENTALGLFSGADSIPFIRGLFDGDRLLVSATAFTGRTLNASFSIEGIDPAIEPLRDLCNW